MEPTTLPPLSGDSDNTCASEEDDGKEGKQKNELPAKFIKPLGVRWIVKAGTEERVVEYVKGVEFKNGEWKEVTRRKKKGQQLKVCCRLCGKYFSYCSWSFTSFTRHLRTHLVLSKEDTVAAKERLEERGDENFDLDGWVKMRREVLRVARHREKNPDQPLIETMFNAKRGLTRKGKVYEARVRAIAEWVAIEGMPLRAVERPAFQAMMSSANSFCGHVCSRTIVKHLKGRWERMKAGMRENLILQISCFTLDYWTKRGGGEVLGVTAHYVWGGELRAVVLGCRSVDTECNNGEKVSETVRELMGEFGQVPRFPTVVTDAGGNVSRAVDDLLGWNWYRCLAHLVHNVVCAGTAEALKYVGSDSEEENGGGKGRRKSRRKGHEEEDATQLEEVEFGPKKAKQNSGWQPVSEPEDVGGSQLDSALEDTVLGRAIFKVRKIARKVRRHNVEKWRFEECQRRVHRQAVEGGEEPVEGFTVPHDLIVGPDVDVFGYETDAEMGTSALGGVVDRAGSRQEGRLDQTEGTTTIVDTMTPAYSRNLSASDPPPIIDDGDEDDPPPSPRPPSPAPCTSSRKFQPLRLPTLVPTRWNSLFFLLKRAETLQASITEYTKSYYPRREILAREWTALELLVSFLEGAKDCTLRYVNM